MIVRTLALFLLYLHLHLRLAPCAGAPAVVAKADAVVERKSASERKISLARAAVERQPKNADARNALALALVRHARDVSDPKFCDQAAEAQTESLRLAPDNFEARKVGILVALGRHEFGSCSDRGPVPQPAPARRRAGLLLLAEACLDTGNYDEAEKAAQWALDMRPGETCGLLCTARLREIFGDLQGAIDLVQTAYAKTPPEESCFSPAASRPVRTIPG